MALFLIIGLALPISSEISLEAVEGYDLWAMGSNQFGQLGDGTTINRWIPILVASNVIAFDAGSTTSYFVASNDPESPLETTLFGMGNNAYGQLRQEPVLVWSKPVVIDSGVQSVSAGHQHVLYTHWDNRLYSMGGNLGGQLGIGTDTDQWKPMLVDSMVKGLAAGGLHSLYIKQDGTLNGMGAAASLGIGETGGMEEWSVTIDTGVVSVEAGGDSLYLKNGGILMGMGYNFSGELGNGTRNEIPWPIVIDTEVVQMSNSGLHSLYVRSDGTLMGMGYNQSGQLGDGSTTDRLRPVQIDTEVVSAAAGAYHSLYIKADGTLMAVGGNSAGQLGDGTTMRRLRPVVVDTGVVAVSAGEYFSLYLKKRPVPMISQPPQSVTAEPGSTATFTVTTGGLIGESFEWRHGDTVIGGNSPTLTLLNIQSSDAGEYTVTVTANGESVSSRSVTLGVKAPPYTEKLMNISTRGQILTGAKIMIAGFVLEGSGQKDVLIRGIGPTLGQWLQGVCTDPKLALFRNTNPPTPSFAENDDWVSLPGDISGQCQRLGAFAFLDGSHDAAIYMPLDPGAYTAKVSGADGTGVGLVELYDADLDPLASTCNLSNISTRGEVGTKAQVLIAGFVIAGEVPKQVLVRGIGPRLADFQVADTLVDPYLQILKDASPAALWVASNDNWSDNPNAADIVTVGASVGAFDLVAGSKDAVILTWLEPGNYTAKVSGVGETTGVALVEVYEVK